MNIVLLTLPFLITFAFAAPPIEGGKSAPMSSFDYIDIHKLELAEGNCTGTKVSPTLILTAAHCVSSVERTLYTQTLNAGFMIPALGLVTNVTVHPKYKEASIRRAVNPKDKLAHKLATLYDVAFIEVKERPSKRALPYPKIISPSNQPTKRKNVELAGYGSQKVNWDGSRFQMSDSSSSIQIAENDWVECPIDYQNQSLDELEALNKSIVQLLSIRAKRVHTIVNSHEEVITDGKGMVLSGDSGSPSLERDSKTNFIISGVASNISNFDDGSGEAEFEIEVDGKVVANQSLNEMPDNWGYAKKSDVNFPEIMEKIKEKELITPEGELKPGVTIKRSYTRYTRGNFADLSHPENQTFIQSIMK